MRGGLRVAVTWAAASTLLFAAGWFARGFPLGREGADRRVRLGGYRFISPLLDVELPEGFDVQHEPIPFKYKVKAYVTSQLASGAVRDLAVYYRDLADGPWFGIDDKKKFEAASLMKIPVMIAWLKRAEADPGVLDRRLVFDPRSYQGPPQATPPARTLAPGESRSVEELLQFMLRYSDNRATWLLFRELREEEIADVLDSMDVQNDPSDAANHVSAHGYSGFLRILFNASYLGKAMSERALELLSHEDFPGGIVAGLPRGVVVASKFGESVAPDVVELHEFAIVYHRRRPYILGVMTRGTDHGRQTRILREVSELVYREVDAGLSIGSPE